MRIRNLLLLLIFISHCLQEVLADQINNSEYGIRIMQLLRSEKGTRRYPEACLAYWLP